MSERTAAKRVDVIVAGAGPSGMAAARTVARGGASVLLVDEQPAPGGQIFRRSAVASGVKTPLLPKYARGIQDVYADASAFGIGYESKQCAWGVSENGSIFVGGARGTLVYESDNLVIATGVSEWALPVPGWTLPGVTTAGGAQALLKTSQVLVGRRIVLGGAGPLLLQVGVQLSAAGAQVLAIFDATSAREHMSAAWGILRHVPTALTGVQLLASLRLRGVPIYRGWAITGIKGDKSAAKIVAGPTDGSFTSISMQVDAVCLSNGLIPAVELAAMRGCSLKLDEALGVWEVERHDVVCTSQPGVYAVGDGAALGGARKAVVEGELAGLCVLERLGKCANAGRKRTLQSKLRRLAPIRAYAQHTMRHRADAIARLDPDVTICRCEDVALGPVLAAIDEGARSLHDLRTRCRIGMGNCQGRMCMPTATRVLAQQTGQSIAQISYPRPRPPVRPLSLHELAPNLEA
jgi:NADPH-dependent 2,4-dienoyl-CoA reductase/sulfur reductase-like enzyme